RSFVDEKMDSEIKGSARLSPEGTVVSLEKPDRQRHELEATHFPTQHLLELLDKARGGETFYETSIFDGSEDADRVMTTTVIIGRSAAAKPNDPEISAIRTLERERFWPVEMAYFDMSEDEGEELPSYRI